MPADFRVSITNAPGEDAYPISSFTWLLLYENPQDKELAKAMVDFMKWALTDGQKLRARPGIRAAAAARRRHRDEGAREDQDSVDVTEAPVSRPSSTKCCFAPGRARSRSLLIVIVGAIAVELVRESRLSIQQFGWQFWQTDVWDPVAGEFGARPFIWGTLYSSILALLISTPIALGIAIFISELSPRWLGRPLVFLTELLAAIPSIVYGLWGVFVLVPFVRQLQAATPPWLKEHSAVHRSAAGRRHAGSGDDLVDHGHPVHVVGRA